MRLHHLESRNPVVIYMGENRDIEIQAKYIDHLNDTMFYIYDQKIHDNIDSFIGKTAVIAVIIHDKLYTAEVRIIGKGGKRRAHSNTVMLETLSAFIQKTRRASVRYAIRTKIKIYQYRETQGDSYKGDFICDAVSEDISGGGMRLVLSHTLRAPGETLVVLDFSIIPNILFPMYSIPSKIMRSHKVVSSYEYGFQFDFTKIPEMHERLLSSIINFKLSGTRNG